MKIDRKYVESFKRQIANEEDCVLFEIVEKGNPEQKIALAETGKYLDELSADENADVRIAAVLNGANPLELLDDEDQEVRFAVVRALDSIMREQHTILFETFDKYGESMYFVIPSRARRAVEELMDDNTEKVRNLAKSVLKWQQARDLYARFGKNESISSELYIKRAHKKLQEGTIEPVPTCFDLGFFENFA